MREVVDTALEMLHLHQDVVEVQLRGANLLLHAILQDNNEGKDDVVRKCVEQGVFRLLRHVPTQLQFEYLEWEKREAYGGLEMVKLGTLYQAASSRCTLRSKGGATEFLTQLQIL